MTAEVETSKFVPVLKPEELPKGAPPLSLHTCHTHTYTNDSLSRGHTSRMARTYPHAASSTPACFP